MQLIRTPEDLQEGAAWLSARDPRLRDAIAAVQPLPLRLRPDGFKGLLDIIISQQVSVASADAIRTRLQDAGLHSAADVTQTGQEGLRAVGFSRPKARYAVLLAEANLDYAALRTLRGERATRLAHLAFQPIAPAEPFVEELTGMTNVACLSFLII